MHQAIGRAYLEAGAGTSNSVTSCCVTASGAEGDSR